MQLGRVGGGMIEPDLLAYVKQGSIDNSNSL